MASLNVLTVQQSDAWLGIIEQCAPHDFYHLPQYHVLAQEEGEGSARLFVYTEGGYTIALPLLLRSLEGIWHDQTFGAGWLDATSVYGYPGPLCSHLEVPHSVIQNFQSALEHQLHELRVVSVFSRLHPFIQQRALLAGRGETAVSNQTVSIDLTVPADLQRVRFRRSHREASNRLRRRGLSCKLDKDGSHFEDFYHIYEETMRRVKAPQQYFFSTTYFKRLRQALGEGLRLFVCQLEGKVICTGLFVTCHGILQYHLGGTLDAVLALAPMKFLVDEVRKWATNAGLSVLHLGGGTTRYPDDSLLYFKKGFSDRTHEFAIWRWVVVPEIHERLCAEKARWNERHRRHVVSPDFFPAYRCLTVPLVAQAKPPALSEMRVGGPS